MFDQIIASVTEALLAIPGVREVMGLVDSRLQPLMGVCLLAGMAYLLSRAAHYLSLRHAREKLRQAQELEIANSRTDRTIIEPAAAATALVPPDENVAAPAPVITAPRTWVTLRRPVLLLGGGAAVIVVAVLAALTRPAPTDATPLESFGPGEASAVAAADTAFRFEDAGSRAEKGACIETIRVTAISRTPKRLSLFIMDAAGAVIGRDVLESPAVAIGTMLDFRFPGIDCARVDEWQVQGEFAND
jgi:hypothetical protein